MSDNLDSVAPPALPHASDAYDRTFVDQSNNILRLFFNRLTSTLGQLISPNRGGRFLYFPYGVFSNHVDQTLATANTPTALSFDTTAFSSGMTLVDTTKITATQPGLYRVAYHGNLAMVTAGTAESAFWFRKNGVDVDWSAQEKTIEGGSVKGPVYLSETIELASDDYVEVMLVADSTDVFAEAIPSTATTPAVPSSRVTISYVSNK